MSNIFLNKNKCFKKALLVFMMSTFFLSACVIPGSRGNFGGVGPKLSSEVDENGIVTYSDNKPRLDIIIPTFNPGLSKNVDYVKDGVWPELRRAEANRFALILKEELIKTNRFGAIRVTPNQDATGDIYILGSIEESDGRTVEINLELYDISGDRWFSKDFDHEVDEAFYDGYRNSGKDPYIPVFAEAAEYIVDKLDGFSAIELNTLKSLTDLRFAASFSDDAFKEYLKIDGEHVELLGLPSKDDPMLIRTKAIRVRDQLFVDHLQDEYELFNSSMNDSYSIWQKESMLESIAAGEARNKAVGQAVLGVLAVGLSIASLVSGSSSKGNLGSGKDLVAIAGAVGGAVLINESFKTSAEAKIHRDALEELGRSIDLEVAPQVVAFEQKTVKLTGDASQQFSQWRAFLKKMYLQEETPEAQL